MKKAIILTILCVLFFNSIFAQNEEELVVKHHEVKTNAFNLIDRIPRRSASSVA